MFAVTWEHCDRLWGNLHWRVFSPKPIVQIKIARLILGHGQQTPSERAMTSPPNRKICSDDVFKLVLILPVVPESDCLVQGTCHDAGASDTVPINSIDFGSMCTDGFDGFRSLSVVPYMQEPIMSRG
jgi:hypothetical protein